MTNRRLAVVGCILGAALGDGVAQAQDVHKCTVNGQVTYQAKACASSDVVVPIHSGPSDQEARDARSSLYRQRFQAATGHLLTPPPAPRAVPAPPPAPAPAGFIIQRAPAITTTTTTTTLVVGANRIVQRTRTTQTTRTGQAPSLPPPANNCEKLNRDNGDAIDRREELKAPGELQSRQEMLANVQAQIDRIHDVAQAGNCRLTR